MVNNTVGRLSVTYCLCLVVGLGSSIGCAPRAREAVGPPPIPARAGALQVDVVYPPEGSRISVRDSNFIFGSVGNGNARLTINGQPVIVEPNGAFLAWLPLPVSAMDTVATYQLIASLGAEAVRIVHTVLTPQGPAFVASDRLGIDSSRVFPRGVWWVREGEIVPIRVWATTGAQVRLVLPDAFTVELTEITLPGSRSGPNGSSGLPPGARAGSVSGAYEGELVVRQPLGRGGRTQHPPIQREAAALENRTCSPSHPVSAPVPTTASNSDRTNSVPCAYLEVAKGSDTVRAPLPLDLWILEEPGPVVELREAPSAFGSDGVIVGRSAPEATFAWLWSEGARARVTGRRNDAVRIALDRQTDAWVALGDLTWLPRARLRSPVRVGSVRVGGQADRPQVRVSVGGPVPYAVRVEDRRVSLVLYGAYSATDRIRYGPEHGFLQSAGWEQLTSDRYELRLDLARKPWGYRVRYEPGALILEVRAPPPIDPERPLVGRRIVVDPGHPPVGAVGPTRLHEADANLAIAFRLKRLLEREGARVTLTRADRAAVRLYDRPIRAVLLEADLLVSIHNNALPDGVNPFENHGTSVFYFHSFEVDLARALQRGLLRELGLRDLGIGRANLALARPTWMPSALTEGAFMMIPAQEAALRTPAFQEAYARGVVEGLREFLEGRLE